MDPFASLPAAVRIIEVGPRDGWQNLAVFLSTDDKVAFIDRLAAAGFGEIEVTSFVNPRVIPQLADADDVFARIERRPGVIYAALVANMRGLERALRAGIDKVGFIVSASETHNRKNIGQSIGETLAEIGRMAKALPPEVHRRVSISNVFGCPFEGQVPVVVVGHIACRLLSEGITEINLCDTWGVATPRQVYHVVMKVREAAGVTDLGLHLHDTCGRAMTGVLAGLLAGVNRFDTAVLGLGGCPFAPGAAGNLASEDLVACLEEMGVDTGIDREALLTVAAGMARLTGSGHSHMLAFRGGACRRGEDTGNPPPDEATEHTATTDADVGVTAGINS
jgi:hydroxymethylglutaryl-CoA lyase